jgi:HSP20 family protein
MKERRWTMFNTPINIKRVPASCETVPDVWQSFQREVDRVFDRFSGGIDLPWMRRMFDQQPFGGYRASFDVNIPAADFTEDEKAYKITVELPGLDEKSVEVSLSGKQLILKGEKRQEKDEKDNNCYLSERSYGSFQRSFRLPESVDQDKIAATLEKGVLTVTLPKTVEVQKQQKKIEIKAA